MISLVFRAMLGSLGGRVDGQRGEGLGVPPAGALEESSAWEDVRRELERSRRYRHAFVLIRVPRFAAAGDEGDAVDRAVLSLPVRNVDRTWCDDRYVYLLLPETDRSMGEAALARFRALLPDLPAEEDVTLVAFPEDGLTSRALLSALDGERVAGRPAAPESAAVTSPALSRP